MFQKVSGIESVRDKRGGGYHNFPSRIFCSTVLENTWGKLLLFRKILVSKKVKDKRKGGYHTFPPKICCLTVPKKSRRGTLKLQKIFSIEKHYG